MPPAGTSLMPAGLKNLVKRYIPGGGGGVGSNKRGRDEAQKEEEERDPIYDSDLDGNDGDSDSLTLATIDWNRYRPLALPLDDDDREALENAGGAGGPVGNGAPTFKARVEFPGGRSGGVAVSPLLRAAATDGAARGARVVNGLPETAWRGGAEDDDDDDERTETEEQDDDGDDDDAGEESEDDRDEAAQAAEEAAAAAARAKEANKRTTTAAAANFVRAESSEDSGDDLEFRLSEAGWPGAAILGATKRDGSTAVKVLWDDGEEKWIDSSVLHKKTHTLVTLVQFYESKAKNKG